MGNLGFQEMLLIAVIALIVFGPERLPELARNAGKAIARFRAETSKSVDELKRAADVQDLDRELRGIRDDIRGIRSSFSGALLAEPSTKARSEDTPPPIDPEAT